MKSFEIGAAGIDRAAREISVNGTTRRMSPKSMAVLDVLIEASGDVVSRDILIERVWPNVTVGEEVLTQAIAELRRAFHDTPRKAAYIETVPKAGYRLAQGLRPSEPPGALLPPTERIPAEHAIEAISNFLAAFDAFDRGGRAWMDKAIEYCRTSIEYDPEFAPAHAQLSAALSYKHLYYGQDGNQLEEALASARRAIACDRTSPDGYAAQGFTLAHLGDFEHAVTSYNAAMRLRHDSYFTAMSFGRVLFARGAFEAASRLFDRAAQLRGDDFHGLMLSAAATDALGDPRRAAVKLRQAMRRCEQRLMDDPEDLRALICQTYCQIHAGGVASAAPLLARLEGNNDPLTYYVVSALARAGEKDIAIDRFEAIVDNGWADPYFLKTDPDLAPLRGERRFRKIADALAA